jgi:hypothetical protein
MAADPLSRQHACHEGEEKGQIACPTSYPWGEREPLTDCAAGEREAEEHNDCPGV